MLDDSKPSIINGRRGRPRKQSTVPVATTTYPTTKNPDTLTTPVYDNEKPREERSYKDFFPSLDIRAPIPIVRVIDATPELESSLQENRPTSPSIDEYETASESELPTKLPIASFEKVDLRDSTDDLDQKGNLEQHNSNYFHRPESHYIRYIEPSESELFHTIEYDMDEQDEVWLQIYNDDRKKEGLGPVSGELFEAVIDQLEKEWFNLIKNLPKKTAEEPVLPEDSKCAVCDDGECENSNAIVFCDGCNLAVHQDCYGIPYIPEGQWLCRKCMVSPENPVSCLFCPGEGGAFKQTTTNQWGHLLCAIWIPEVGLSNSVYMEPIDNIESVPKSRWKLTCYICRRRHGACIQCDNKNCFVAFHVTCARWARLCMRMKLHGTHYDGVVLKAYCERHTPKDYKETVDVDTCVMNAQQWFSKHKKGMPRHRYVDEEDEDSFANPTASNLILWDHDSTRTKKQRRQQAVTQLLPASKAARAHQHQYTAGAPIAPEYILNKLEHLPCVRQATKLKHKSSIVTSICRYWSLKRESRRGAPLLKRLHLEPWTASASQLKQSEVEKAHKASSMMSLRADIEKLRLLSEQVRKRERQKLERIRKQKAYLETILYPIEFIIKPILDQLIELDKKEFFRYPVTLELAFDYYDIIKQPMSFQDIMDKLATHEYSNLQEFEDDLSLIWKNCMIYNKPETPYYKLAQRLEKITEELMIDARTGYENLDIRKQSGTLNVDIDPEIFTYGDKKADHREDDKENNKPTIEDSSLSSLTSLGSSSSNGSPTQDKGSNLKRRISMEDVDTNTKKPRHSSLTEESMPIKSRHRVTRSYTEKNKRTLRSRSITKDTHHPVKIKSPPPPKARPLLKQSKKQEESVSERLKKRAGSAPANPREYEEGLTTKQNKQQEPMVVKQAHKGGRKKEIQTQGINYQKESLKVEFAEQELVWARVRGFPAHPAYIVIPEVTKKKIPENVLVSKGENDDVLVWFLLVSEAHTWGWIPKSNIVPFGNFDTDVAMLHQAKKTRKAHRIKEVKAGYRHACELIHIDPQSRLDQVFKR